MEASFTFDLEDTRLFSRSSTGKTSWSDLQFQVLDDNQDDYRPLTGSTQRDPRTRIVETLVSTPVAS